MNRSIRTRLVAPALLAVGAGLMLGGPATAGAAGPKIVGPKTGATFALGAEPTFKVRDASAAARQYKVFMTVSTTKKTKRNGDLKQTESGTFTSMNRKGNVFSYTMPDYDFPDWIFATAGTYYWQAFHIDCVAVRSCHVHSKIGRFTVQ